MTVQAHQVLRRGIWLFILVLFVFVFPVVAQDAQDAALEGDAHAGKGEWAKALADYRHAVALDPKKADYRARLGTALSKVGEGDEAPSRVYDWIPRRVSSIDRSATTTSASRIGTRRRFPTAMP